MTIIAFTKDTIYSDCAATTSVIARTFDGKVIRLGESILVACAGLALTEAEMSCLSPLIPQIIACRTPHDGYELLDEISEIFSKSNLDTTLVFTTPYRYLFLSLGRFRNEVDIFTRDEMDKMPMAIGSGALQFIHNFEILKDVEKAVIAAALNDPHCGRDILSIDIKDLGKGVEEPVYVPRIKPKREGRPDRPRLKMPLPFAIPLPPRKA